MNAKTNTLFIVITLCGVLLSSACMAQDTATGAPHIVHHTLPPLPLVPEFPGGRDSLAAFIKQHTRYPRAARRHHITGVVEVDFWVDEKGNLSKLHVLKPLGYGCDREALHVVKKMPQWKPGRLGPKPMAMDFHVDIPFGETDKK